MLIHLAVEAAAVARVARVSAEMDRAARGKTGAPHHALHSALAVTSREFALHRARD